MSRSFIANEDDSDEGEKPQPDSPSNQILDFELQPAVSLPQQRGLKSSAGRASPANMTHVEEFKAEVLKPQEIQSFKEESP